MTYFLYLLLILFFFTFLSESTHHPKNSWEEHFVIWTKWFFLSRHVAAVHFSGIFFQMVLNSRKFHSSSTYFQSEINVYLNLRHSFFVTEKNWENREANGEPKWQRSILQSCFLEIENFDAKTLGWSEDLSENVKQIMLCKLKSPLKWTFLWITWQCTVCTSSLPWSVVNKPVQKKIPDLF